MQSKATTDFNSNLLINDKLVNVLPNFINFKNKKGFFKQHPYNFVKDIVSVAIKELDRIKHIETNLKSFVNSGVKYINDQPSTAEDIPIMGKICKKFLNCFYTVAQIYNLL